MIKGFIEVTSAVDNTLMLIAVSAIVGVGQDEDGVFIATMNSGIPVPNYITDSYESVKMQLGMVANLK